MTLDMNAKRGDVVLLVGTRKGAFLMSANASRRDWDLSGPHFPGSDIFHMAYDPRDGGTVFAAVNSIIWGSEIQRSHDLGTTWLPSAQAPKLNEDGDTGIKQIWHIEPGRPEEPGAVYAGVEPAALFKSEDGGDTWSHMNGLAEHPTRPDWQPGLGGLCLHSIVTDGSDVSRMWVGVSAAGTFGSVDDGQTWDTMNKGVRADFLPDRYPEFGQCVHKMLSPTAMPQRLYQQNHCGVYRSDNRGADWVDISEGLPSRWGMPLGLHPQDPDTLFVVPEDRALGDETGGAQRFVTNASFRVFRSRNAGNDWAPLTDGLPQQNAYLHVMREGVATDNLDPCGVYVGTSTGHVFYSRDEGDHWELLADYLPPINSVDCGIVA